MDGADLKAALIARALEIGFDAVRVTKAHLPEPTRDRYHAALAAGYHGEMAWLAQTADRRQSPDALWAEARTAIILVTNYGPAYDPLALIDQREHGVISAYAQHHDYHDLIKKRLKQLGRWFAQTTGHDLKVFVDTAPILEKPLAQQAGVGWQGKHTNLVSKEFGSWLFLSEILTTFDLPFDQSEEDHCGSCTRCLAICPTQAFPKPYQLDARRCIAYLTIEYKGIIPYALRPMIGNRIYGCDDCLAVCPWNKFAKKSKEYNLKSDINQIKNNLEFFLNFNDEEFRKFFQKSPIKRTGRDVFIRNVIISIGNSLDKKYIEKLKLFLKDESFVVRDAAAWAIYFLISH